MRKMWVDENVPTNWKCIISHEHLHQNPLLFLLIISQSAVNKAGNLEANILNIKNV